MPSTTLADRTTPFRLDRDVHPALVSMTDALRANHRFAADIADRCAALFGARWADEFELVVAALFPTPEAVAAAVKGYAAFAMQSMRLQAAFEVEGRYRPKTHGEAASEVYFNEQHMMREYLPGLLLSHFLWPHHYRQVQFFDSAFVDVMRMAGASSFVEVGTGTGLYSGMLLRRLPAVRGTGFDISPSSIRFTQDQLEALGVGHRYEAQLRDVVADPPGPLAEWLVCVEVLEHLDDPVAFLRGLRATMAPGGRAFITAALNAAHADHVHLYRSHDDVLAHLVEAGFTLEQSFVGAAYRPSGPGVPVPLAAAFVVH
ncbi:methyltransferase [Modestobacter muralis]|uniref:Methyltransferase n=1 Tax=Modestobacter muralis TaxID=1608614 RepID=A0A6P0EYM6_9ACTN|nr:class I SAM-dependent methyltransferase [Modestobacter muralis]NEK94934.1 methyltransferase [Modestobacter muralis]NEN51822.1 methyltransferase [Modestobacter muralis]